MNDAVVRLGVIEGDFHWHKHDDQDEFFLVLEGRLLIDLEDRDTVTLDRHHGYTVPRGVVHRARAPERTAILMVEAAGVAPVGDCAATSSPGRNRGQATLGQPGRPAGTIVCTKPVTTS